MKTRTLFLPIGFALTALLGFWLGYSRGQYHWPSDGSPWPRGLTLAKVLEQRGISPATITSFRFVGDESSRTTGRVAVETDVSWIWDSMIATAEPYSHWLSSGYRRVEIFTLGGQQPAAVLLVNETDATSIEGDSRRFMCHGLEDLALHLLSSPQTAKNK
jgi:hypothetical protein